MQILDDKQSRLLDTVRGYESCAVAFSGGVDSAVVCQAAALALGDRAVAITGSSNSLAAGELESARELARQIGIRHEVIETAEFQQADYTRNAADRCFHCKTELYGQMRRVAERLGLRTLANGANLDDLGDYRPGLKAAADFDVQSPLADCGFTKADVRALARRWELPVWNKPAAPCLSSRVAYGQQVTPERLAMIDVAERFLRSHGLPRCACVTTQEMWRGWKCRWPTCRDWPQSPCGANWSIDSRRSAFASSRWTSKAFVRATSISW